MLKTAHPLIDKREVFNFHIINLQINVLVDEGLGLISRLLMLIGGGDGSCKMIIRETYQVVG